MKRHGDRIRAFGSGHPLDARYGIDVRPAESGRDVERAGHDIATAVVIKLDPIKLPHRQTANLLGQVAGLLLEGNPVAIRGETVIMKWPVAVDRAVVDAGATRPTVDGTIVGPDRVPIALETGVQDECGAHRGDADREGRNHRHAQ